MRMPPGFAATRVRNDDHCTGHRLSTSRVEKLCGADERIDVLEYFDEDNQKDSGFNIALPASLFEDDSDVVKIFALSEDGRGSKLRYLDDFRWKHGS